MFGDIYHEFLFEIECFSEVNVKALKLRALIKITLIFDILWWSLAKASTVLSSLKFS